MWIGKFALFLAFAAAQLAIAQPVTVDYVEVELVSEPQSIRPGEPFTVALRIDPEPGWYTYWRNPGDVGLATRIDWALPEGSETGEIQWPFPKSFDADGIVSHGYDSEVLLLTEIRPPASWPADQPFVINANAFWLMCHDVCIPGNAELTLTLPVTDAEPQPDPRWQVAFKLTRRLIPQPTDQAEAYFELDGGQFSLLTRSDAPLFANAREVVYLPYENDLIVNTEAQRFEARPNRLYLTQRGNAEPSDIPASLGGAIRITSGVSESSFAVAETVYEIKASHGLPATMAMPEEVVPRGAKLATDGLPFTLLLALGGGLLLNLMPCVFPVLSLKIMSVVESAHCTPREQRLHGIAYTLGVLVFFTIIGGLLLLLRAGGESIGWGFQLQSPWFVGFLIYLLFVMALSFAGTIEFGAGFMGFGDSLAGRGGYVGSFFTGVLAVVVASPCSAPFMGTAIGVGLSQPPLISLSIFLTLGLGMALPFLVIAFVPALGRVFPKPGPWMNVFRQSMAFPLYLTVVWLIWVLGRQTGIDGVAIVLCGMILLRFAIWVWSFQSQTAGGRRKLGWALTWGPVIGALMLLQLPFLNAPLEAGDVVAEAGSKSGWQSFSAERLAQLRSQNKPVFVNMTADWCMICLANERVALSFPSVTRNFKDKGVALLKGDWTNRDPEITRYLQQYGREGVPLYVLYPAQPEGKPQVLPQVLTPMLVQDALKKI
jgi:thiol:disulfide interchange protein DsbD